MCHHAENLGTWKYNFACACTPTRGFRFLTSQGAKASDEVEVEIPTVEWGAKEPDANEPGEEKTSLEPLVIAGKMQSFLRDAV